MQYDFIWVSLTTAELASVSDYTSFFPTLGLELLAPKSIILG